MTRLMRLDVRIHDRTRLAAVGAAILLGVGVLISGTMARAGENHEFNEPGNYLIADQFNNRVIEVEPDGDIVWQFGKGPADLTETSIIGTNDAQRVGDFTLMAGTGIPAGQLEAPNCTSPTGCLDNRVILVNRNGRIVWQYGQFGVSGSGPDQLNTPVQNTWLPEEDEHDKGDIRGSEIPHGHVLITDQGNERIIEVDLNKNIVWQYGTTGVVGNGPNQLSNPNSAELLENGHILIADENNNRAIEVDRALNIIHTYTAGGTVSGVAFASRLENGDTLLTDSNDSRIVEVDKNDQKVWEYFTNTDPSSNNNRPGGGPLPTRAVRLKNGHTLISDQYNHRVVEVDKNKEIVRTFGKINMLGYDTVNVGNGGLNSPYDAKKIGDYTGLTPPTR
jgi:hypothetical protein